MEPVIADSETTSTDSRLCTILQELENVDAALEGIAFVAERLEQLGLPIMRDDLARAAMPLIEWRVGALERHMGQHKEVSPPSP